jgi:DNA (cytosine-5)-methyltransferase 1
VLTKKVYRKFEWNCGPNYKDFKNCIIQFRQSGLRIKNSDKFPSLVAIVNTPIIFDNTLNEYRRITIREAANLQSFRKNYNFICEKQISYKQLGNSVNVKVIKIIAKALFSLAVDNWDEIEEE